ncbi:MAG TPA: hypothetical protein ENO14_02110 [Chromatiales bacterium]|nr:hypothetical protein [Chromatiales bacterium]
MAGKKIACLGGGSFYFRRIMADLPLASDLAGSEVVLYDIEFEKARRMAEMGARLAGEAATGLKVRAARRLADALDGCDFAIASIGASGAGITSNVYDSWFHNADVHIPAKYGIHQIIGDTCGPAGMMMGLRSVPAYMKIAAEMEKRCPKAILFNHSNPMAVICRALNKYSNVKIIGICHGVQHGIRDAALALGVEPTELEVTWVGTNHYYWFTRVSHRGKDLYPQLRRITAETAAPQRRRMSTHLSNIYGYHVVYAYDNHSVEFYPFLAQVKGQDDLPYGLKADALEHGYDASKPLGKYRPPSERVRARFFRDYQRILDQTELPEKIDDSITSEGMASLLSAISLGRRQMCIVNVPNRGAVSNLPGEMVLEVEAVTDSMGVRALLMDEAPLVLKGMLEKRFAWQELVADAAVKGDRNAALQALLVDEMAIWPDRAEKMLDELLAASKPLLGQFKL